MPLVSQAFKESLDRDDLFLKKKNDGSDKI